MTKENPLTYKLEYETKDLEEFKKVCYFIESLKTVELRENIKRALSKKAFPNYPYKNKFSKEKK